MKKTLFLFLALSFLISLKAYSEGKSPLDRKFKLNCNNMRTYKSDRSISIPIYIENLPDSVITKYSDSLQWIVKDLPFGANFHKSFRNFEIEWDKFGVYTGNFNFQVILSTPYFSDTLNIPFEVEEEWNSYFIPGISYSAYLPQNSEHFGTFQGFSIEYLIYTGIHRNENKGPSHIKLYGKFDLMTSNKKEITESFNYSLGINLSFERNPKRRFLIPFFGLDVGCLYQKEMGNIFCFTPTAGLWIYSDMNLMVHCTAGYLYPSESIEKYRGMRIMAGANFSLW